MGRIANIQVTCKHCGKTTNVYIEESGASSANVKCEHCRKVFEFSAGMLYTPVGYVSEIPPWARIDELGETLMRVKGTCPACGTEMSFEQAANFARKNGISDNVVMCAQCRSVYTIDLTPRAMSFAADVTERYPHLQNTAAKSTPAASAKAETPKMPARQSKEGKPKTSAKATPATAAQGQLPKMPSQESKKRIWWQFWK